MLDIHNHTLFGVDDGAESLEISIAMLKEAQKQQIDAVIPGDLPEGRTKPWGTGQAVLAAREKLKTPFIVINADDYYGKEGFRAIYKYLLQNKQACMAGFILKNTLSDNGGVTRGICQMDEQNDLTEINFLTYRRKSTRMDVGYLFLFFMDVKLITTYLFKYIDK